MNQSVCPELPGNKPSTTEYTIGTQDFSCICSRGWPSQSPMGGEALGPVKVPCHNIGECQGQEAELGGLESREGGYTGLLQRKLENGIAFEI